MRIIFRADASAEMGSGHVMRSSVIAENAIRRGHECIFVGSVLGLDWVKKRVDELGFTQICKPSEFKFNSNTDVCVIDSYTEAITSIYGSRRNWRLLVSIQDESTPKFDADIFIVPSLTTEGPIDSRSRILSGPDYVLIRKSIRKCPPTYPNVEPFTVIISGGGSDPFAFAEEAAKLIDKIEIEGQFHFFTNNKIISNSDKIFITHNFGDSMDLIAQKTHAVLTTASTSSLEFIAREIPTAVVCSVENQSGYYTKLMESNLVCALGSFNKSSGWDISFVELDNFLRNSDCRIKLSEKMSGLIDLEGANRVLQRIENEISSYLS
jgi:spore coat polysaccharide biosynthesis predicted glycosyltransferase SpsG